MSDVCRHGQLRRQCPICELEAELSAERAKVAELQDSLLMHQMELSRYSDRAIAAESQAARLRETIEKAPHDKTCGVNFKGVCRCTCWKSRALQGEPK